MRVFARGPRFAALATLPIAGALCASIVAFAVHGQSYPAQPVKLVVPFAPGGATDILARTIGQRLAERLGQPVVIENKPGAGTTIGNAAVAQSAADGYTLLFAPTPFVISQVMYPKLPYDPDRAFSPVTLLAVSPFILVAHPSLKAASVAELVALAKSAPVPLTFASAGNGTVPHLAGELFRLRTGIALTHVPYKGGGPAITDLVGGQTQLMFATPIEVMPQVQAGRLKVLATTAATRLAGLPDVPTVQESGYAGFEVHAWFGVLAPAGTPKPIVERLAGDLAHVVELPDVKDKLAGQSAQVALKPGDEFAAFIAAEKAKWDAVVKASGAKVD
jgi:tripartite-type tricarboxylate transporter receptor subunit TctC